MDVKMLAVGLVIGLIIGAAAGYLGGAGGAASTATVTKTATVTTTATSTIPTTVTTTVVQTVTPTGPSTLEALLRNGTYWSRCVFCNMLINDTRFAALVVLEGGHTVRTDDIGCIFRMALLPPEKWRALQRYPPEDVKRLVKVEKVFVPDFHTGEYVEAEKAYYVIRQDMKTPMGDCVLAFKDPNHAKEMNSTVYTYSQMLQLYRQVMQERGMPRPNWCRGGMAMHQHGG
ncbi:nitrous oxide reductase accessory protein NosL [Pyrobaculum ferrireducens]|uniref:Lipoprotein, putative n=1 Tax=Pyrobaculum ferrireducens TaxID=1104324 RepID=G7VIA3_9CREN|nr:nitrous oxide reductase accessory protein NosL [Pyrobaculum ferrireducens]AET32195.1 lipoprotein, putative [Pyrobaculum ferrireducens]